MRRFGTLVVAAVTLALGLAGCREGGRQNRRQENSAKSAALAPFRWIGSLGSNNDNTPKREPVAPSAKVAPDLREATVETARYHLEQQNYERALAVADKVLEREPRNARALSVKGDCLHQLGRFREATRAYRAALTLEPDYYPAMQGLGFAEFNLGDQQASAKEYAEAFNSYRQALATLRRAAERLPSDRKVAYGRGLAAYRIANYLSRRAYKLREIKDLHGAETMYAKSAKLYDEAADGLIHFLKAAPRQRPARETLARNYRASAVLSWKFAQKLRARQQLEKAAVTWSSILNDFDREDEEALRELAECRELMAEWDNRERPVGGGATGPRP